MLGLFTLLTAALLAAPAAADPEPKKPEDIGQQLTKLQEAFQKSIETLQGDLRVYDQAMRSDLKELRQRVGQLEKQVKDLEARLDAGSTRRAFSPPVGGRIRLMNMFTLPATVRVNGTSYFLAPGQTRDIEGQPVGAFTYEVLVDGFGSVQPPTTRELRANETYTIYLYPR
jgi:uncharacterized protein YlxW (UPF0749 family)